MNAGPTISSQHHQNLSRLNAALARLKTHFGVLYEKIIANVAPALETVVNWLTKIVTWASKHDEIATCVAVLISLSTAIKGLMVAQSVVTALTGLKGILTGISALGSIGGVAGIGAAATSAATGLAALASSLAVFIGVLGLAGAVGYGGGWLMAKLVQWFNEPTTEEEKDLKKAMEQNLEVLQKGMKFSSTEERLKYMASLGTDYWKKYYDDYLEKQRRASYGEKGGTVPNLKPEELPEGVEYAKDDESIDEEYGYGSKNNGYFFPEGYEKIKPIDSSKEGLIVNVSNNTEVTQNSDGTYTTDTTTEVSGGRGSVINKAYNVTTGGKY